MDVNCIDWIWLEIKRHRMALYWCPLSKIQGFMQFYWPKLGIIQGIQKHISHIFIGPILDSYQDYSFAFDS